MNANVLTKNYRQYIKLQLDLQRAMYRNKIDPCPDRIKRLIEQIQDPAQKLTDFEKDYADWVLELYHPETGVCFKELKEDLRNNWSNTRLYAFRAAMRGRMHFSPNSNWAEIQYFERLPLTHLGQNEHGNQLYAPLTLEQQREWVEDLADKYRKEA